MLFEGEFPSIKTSGRTASGAFSLALLNLGLLDILSSLSTHTKHTSLEIYQEKSNFSYVSKCYENAPEQLNESFLWELISSTLKVTPTADLTASSSSHVWSCMPDLSTAPDLMMMVFTSRYDNSIIYICRTNLLDYIT